MGSELSCKPRKRGEGLPLSPSSLPSFFFFLREFLSCALLSERLEHASIFSTNHFRVPKTLTFNTRLHAKRVLFAWELKKSHFHINGYALNLALKQRLGLTQKRRIVWPIKTVVENSVHQSELEATLTCTGVKRGKAHATKSLLFLLFTFHRSRGFNQSTVLRHGSEADVEFFFLTVVWCNAIFRGRNNSRSEVWLGFRSHFRRELVGHFLIIVWTNSISIITMFCWMLYRRMLVSINCGLICSLKERKMDFLLSQNTMVAEFLTRFV